jgi:hypothetical protein
MFEKKPIQTINVVLKGALLSCLLYVLAHENTLSSFYKKIFIGISRNNTIYVSLIIFIIVYYIINVFL